MQERLVSIQGKNPLSDFLPIYQMMNFLLLEVLMDHFEFEIHYFYNYDKFFQKELNIDKYKKAVDRLYKSPVVME